METQTEDNWKKKTPRLINPRKFESGDEREREREGERDRERNDEGRAVMWLFVEEQGARSGCAKRGLFEDGTREGVTALLRSSGPLRVSVSEI